MVRERFRKHIVVFAPGCVAQFTRRILSRQRFFLGKRKRIGLCNSYPSSMSFTANGGISSIMRGLSLSPAGLYGSSMIPPMTIVIYLFRDILPP